MAPLVAASGLPAAEELAETDSPPLSSCGSTEDCLQVVDTFLEGQPRTSAPRAGLMQTFGPTPQGGGGPCGQFCQLRPECVADDCRFDPYDSAVAAIYFTRRGKLEDARPLVCRGAGESIPRLQGMSTENLAASGLTELGFRHEAVPQAQLYTAEASFAARHQASKQGAGAANDATHR